MSCDDLTTLPDVRAWLNLGTQPYTSTDDALLTRLITAASQFVQSWLCRPITSADWQEVRDGPGSFGWETSLTFAVQPVSAVLLVAVNNFIVPPVPNQVPVPIGQAQMGFPIQPGYVFTPTALTIRGYPVRRERASVLMQYTAGFATVPFDVAQATIELVCRKYRERTRIGEVAKSLGGGETARYETVSFSLRDMASDIQVLLQQYRQVAPVFGSPPQMAPTQFDPATLVAAA
jgi:Phage gp6-like head-tail connector protein